MLISSIISVCTSLHSNLSWCSFSALSLVYLVKLPCFTGSQNDPVCDLSMCSLMTDMRWLLPVPAPPVMKRWSGSGKELFSPVKYWWRSRVHCTIWSKASHCESLRPATLLLYSASVIGLPDRMLLSVLSNRAAWRSPCC